MGRLALVALLWVVLLAATAARAGAEAGWQTVMPEAPLAGTPGVHETRWLLVRPPGAASDRIQLHRYRGDGPARAALLYLPGAWMNGHAALRDPRYSLWLHLASRGIEVFALDYRTHFVAPDPGEHAFMRDWTLERFVDDARAAAALARRESGRSRLFVAGFSRGATLAFGVACSEPPRAVAGLVVLDGPFKRAAPEVFDFEAERAALIASGRLASDVAGGIGWPERHRLMAAAASDPEGPALAADFDSVGDQVARLLYDAWRPGGLADPVHGVSRVEVLARLLDGYDRYWPAIQNLEGRRIASQPDDPHTTLDDAWGELAVPVLYFGATGMGPEWILDGIWSVVRSGSPDVSLHVLEGWGHLDVLVGERARAEVFEPTSAWILDRSPAPGG